jgi:N utilization substance protein B
MASRRNEREYAIKITFAHYFNNEEIDDIVKNLKETDEHAEEAITDYSLSLARHAAAEREALDAIIAPRLTGWELERIPKIDHVILRVAISEMESQKAIPASVIINEYLELTKMFSSQKSRKFINGVLDTIARAMRG